MTTTNDIPVKKFYINFFQNLVIIFCYFLVESLKELKWVQYKKKTSRKAKLKNKNNTSKPQNNSMLSVKEKQKNKSTRLICFEYYMRHLSSQEIQWLNASLVPPVSGQGRARKSDYHLLTTCYTCAWALYFPTDKWLTPCTRLIHRTQVVKIIKLEVPYIICNMNSSWTCFLERQTFPLDFCTKRKLFVSTKE